MNNELPGQNEIVDQPGAEKIDPVKQMTIFRAGLERGLKKGKEKVKKKIAENVIFKKGSEKVKLRVAENVVLRTPRNYPEKYEETISEFGKNEDTIFVLIGSHSSHVGAFTLMEEAEHIRQMVNENRSTKAHIPGSAFLFAGNIDGGQNEGVTDNWRNVQPILNDLNVEKILVLRNKDVQQLKLTNEHKEEAKKEEKRQISNAIELNKSILILVEGTVQSGRYIKDKDGNITDKLTGMMPFTPGALAYIEILARRQNKKVVFIPIGNEGENRLHDPNTGHRTKEALMLGLKREVPILKNRVNSILRSVVGHPISYEQIVNVYGKDGRMPKGLLEQILGEITGQLVPKHMRGVYRNPIYLDRMPTNNVRRSHEVFPEEN